MKKYILLLLSVLLFGCDTPNQTEQSQVESTVRAVDTVVYKQMLYEYCPTDIPENKRIKVTFEYPTLPDSLNSVVSDSLKTKINDLLAADEIGSVTTTSFDPAVWAAAQQKAYTNYIKQGAALNTPWEFRKEINIIHSNYQVVSIKYLSESYAGGAHGAYVELYFTFDRQTGKTLQLDDLFTAENKVLLTQIAEKKFRAARQIPTGQTLVDAGFEFADGKFALNNNFALAKDGIVFYYNAYEIAAYYMGGTEVFLPYQDIRRLFKTADLLD
jgi:hypothetical protein